MIPLVCRLLKAKRAADGHDELPDLPRSFDDPNFRQRGSRPPWILSTARSVVGIDPHYRWPPCLRDPTVTMTLSAASITWLLVRMWPSGRIIDPEPVPALWNPLVPLRSDSGLLDGHADHRKNDLLCSRSREVRASGGDVEYLLRATPSSLLVSPRERGCGTRHPPQGPGPRPPPSPGATRQATTGTSDHGRTGPALLPRGLLARLVALSGVVAAGEAALLSSSTPAAAQPCRNRLGGRMPGRRRWWRVVRRLVNHRCLNTSSESSRRPVPGNNVAADVVGSPSHPRNAHSSSS